MSLSGALHAGNLLEHIHARNVLMTATVIAGPNVTPDPLDEVKHWSL